MQECNGGGWASLKPTKHEIPRRQVGRRGISRYPQLGLSSLADVVVSDMVGFVYEAQHLGEVASGGLKDASAVVQEDRPKIREMAVLPGLRWVA